MNLDKTKKSLIFGLPHSRIIDNILSLRDIQLSIEYYTTYILKSSIKYDHASIYRNMFQNYATLSLPISMSAKKKSTTVIKSTPKYDTVDILPIFSFCGKIYYIMSDFNSSFTVKGDDFNQIQLKKVKDSEHLFYNMDFSIEEFEKMLIDVMYEENIIKHFVAKLIMKDQ